MPIFSRRQPMRRLSVDSGEESASSTATLTDFWSASGTSSIADDSSSSRGSSMPWAAEAIEQNRRDWLQIDEMLYGERELPKNERLHKELLQWRERFPHIRTRGRAVGLSNFNAIQIGKSYKDEEVIAIDPPTRKGFLFRFQPNHLDGPQSTESPTNRFVSNTSQLLEKCLRITSSSWSKRPTVTSDNARLAPPITLDSNPSAVRIKSVRSDIQCQSSYPGKLAVASYGRTFSSSNVELKTPIHQHEAARSSLLRYRRPPPDSLAVPLIDVRSTRNWTASRSTAGRSSRLVLPPITNHHFQGGLHSRPSNIPVSDKSVAARSVSALHDLRR